jgi:hypothetical protein
VLPVYVHAEWQVEEVLLDRGDGLRSWWEIRHGDDATLECRTTAEVDRYLTGHGLALHQLTPTDTIDDGCE